MAKYLVETYYTCSFKVSHYLDDVNEQNLQSLEKREDGKFEILDVKLDNRKTKNLEKIDNKNSNKIDSTVITPVLDSNPKQTSKINDGFKNAIEVGPGRVLQGLTKRIDRSLNMNGVESHEQIVNFKYV